MPTHKLKWDFLFTNANLATMVNGDSDIINHAAIAIHENKISWIGKQSKLPNHQAKNIMDVKNKWILPGFIDCHSHLVYAGNRANEFALRLQGKTYEDIARAGGGILATVRETRQASEATLYQQSTTRLKTFINEGITTLEIKSGYGLDLETEIKMLRVARKLSEDFPIRIKTSYLGAHAVPPEYKAYKNNADAYINYICEEVLPVLKENNLADYVDGFCENIAFNPQQIAKVFQRAKALGFPLKLHAEQLSDLKSAALAAHYGALSADHLDYVNEESIKAMAKANTVAVLLPGANYFLRATKKPPIDLLRKYKVPMAIATDCNPGSSPISSLLLILNMACVLFNLTSKEALKAVTINAALALNIQDNVGSLAVGKEADLVIWEIDHPIDIIYNIGSNPRYATFKDGVLYKSIL